MTDMESEPTFAVPLSKLVDISESEYGKPWWWWCLVGSRETEDRCGYNDLPSESEARSDAIEHLAEVHGIHLAGDGAADEGAETSGRPHGKDDGERTGCGSGADGLGLRRRHPFPNTSVGGGGT